MFVHSILQLLLFTIHVLYHGRQMEIASCLDFLWKKQAKKELKDMTEMRGHTNQLGAAKIQFIRDCESYFIQISTFQIRIFEIFAFRSDFHSFLDYDGLIKN